MAPHRRAVNAVRRARLGGRRIAVAPWIVVSAVVALLLSGLSFGYLAFARRGCDGKPLTITVVASPDQQKVMSGLAQKWQDSGPSLDGRCVAATIAKKDSSEVAAGLSPNWDARRDGPRPDVWAPDSNAWLLVASDRADALAMLPQDPQNLASSAVVIAMPQPMAQALQWPQAKLGWRDLVSKFGGGKSWADITRADPSWGRFQIGMTNPATSTAGLHALFAITDFNNDESVSDEELKTGLLFERTVTKYEPDTAQLFGGLAKADAESKEKALQYVSAFPALERDVSTYNATNPKVPLAAIYPQEGTADANYPYAILKAPWVDRTKQQIAQKFFTYLRSATGREAYGAAGFRDADRSTRYTRQLSAERGFEPRIEAAPRALTFAASVTRTIISWTALRRRANILAVLDTSGSMAEPADGNRSKLQVVQQAAIKATSLFSEDTKLGLWEFATKRTPTSDFKELVPVSPIGGTVGGLPTRLALGGALQRLQPKGATALYDTAYAAYLEAERHWEAGRINIVVLMTDGKNEDPNGGLDLPRLLSQLKAEQKPDKPVQIVTIGFGPDADISALQAISRTTGGRTFTSHGADDIEKVFLAALFGSR
jgi:Ca-activated chloride channel family protein